jgi:RNA polymerase sigma-70 factor (ECF subfamily)
MTAVAVASRLDSRLDSALLASDPLDVGLLVDAHLAGDSRAFTEIVRRYQPRLIGFVTRIIRDRERAEDLVQEAFVRAYRHLHRFDRCRKFSTWVYTIAANLARNELRNRQRSPLVYFQTLSANQDDDARPLEFADHSTRPDRLYHNRHLRQAVDATVARLSPAHREVFVMRELEGLSYEEIAERTRTQLGTVKSRLNRARAQFAEMIEPLID